MPRVLPQREPPRDSHADPAALVARAPAADAKPRYAVLDFVRLMAVLVMIQGHAIGTFVVPDQIPTQGLGGDLYMRLRGLTSPTFLLVSGLVNFVGLRRDGRGRVLPRILRTRVQRAIILILVDYLLIFPGHRVWDLFFLTSNQWFAFFRVGTLNIIGVSLLLATGLMAVTRSNRALLAWSLVIGTGITIATPYVHQVDWFARIPSYFAHYLSFGGGGFFAIFPHTAFFFLGLAIGGYTRRLLEDRRRWTFAIGCVAAGVAILLVTIGGYRSANALLPPHNYWTSSPFTVGEKVGLSMVLIGLWSVIFRFTEGAASFYSRLSGKTLYIYVAHVVLIFGHAWVWSFSQVWRQNLSLTQGIGAAALVIILSYGIGTAAMRLEEHHPRTWARVRVGAGVLLVWLLFFGN